MVHMIQVRLLIVALLSVWLFSPVAGASGRSIPLNGAVTVELNELLELTTELHDSLVEKDEDLIEVSLDRIMSQLARTKKLSFAVADHTRSHLERILEAIRIQFEMFQATDGETKRGHLKEAFYQLAHLRRIYDLDSKFRIVFCEKDRASWVQVGWKAKNPVNPETLGSCGKVVN